MRIGVVTTSYPRFPGDPAGNFVAELTEWISRCGHRTEVVAAGDTAVDDSWQNVPVERVSAPPGLFYRGGAPDALEHKDGARAAVQFGTNLAGVVRRRARHWDGIVAHWLAPSALVAAAVAPHLPLWAIAHGGDVHLLRRLRLSRAAALLLRRPSVHVNFVSRTLQETFSESAGTLARALVQRSSIEPMGVDLAHFQRLPQTRNENTRPVLLFLGRLVPIKGVDVLLSALARVSADVQVIIAGAGPEESALKKQARELTLDVEWPGEVHGACRDALLARATLVVVPSRAFGSRVEGMPRVALEALAAGAQLLVTDSGGLAEIPDSACHRVPGEDATALARKIERVASGQEARFAPGHWLENRGWDVLGPRLLPGLSMNV